MLSMCGGSMYVQLHISYVKACIYSVTVIFFLKKMAISSYIFTLSLYPYNGQPIPYIMNTISWSRNIKY